MNYSHSLKLSLTLERLIVTSVLTAVITMSLPLRAIAAEVMIPHPPTVQVEASAKRTTATFTVPAKAMSKKDVSMSVGQVTETSFNPDSVRESTTGYKVVRVMKNVPSTAYTSRPEETDDTPFIAADGTHVFDGMVAANFLKFKTKIRIPELYGDKIFTVHDRMNKRYNVKVDIWMDDLQKARQHGVRHLTIEIVEPVTEEATS